MGTYVKGPEYSKESFPDMALQSPEAKGLLLDGEGAALEGLSTTRVLAGALGVELAIAVVEVAGGDLAGPPCPH